MLAIERAFLDPLLEPVPGPADLLTPPCARLEKAE